MRNEVYDPVRLVLCARFPSFTGEPPFDLIGQLCYHSEVWNLISILTRGGEISKPGYRINEQIRAREVRLIGKDGKQIGVVPLREALNAARGQRLDLVEVAPSADPPVCRVMDHGKYVYERAKREREARKAQKTIEVKEIRMRPKTDEYHRGFKVKRAREWLQEGAKVKVRVLFRGREITHPEIGRAILQEIAEELSDIAQVEQRVGMEGRTMLMVLGLKTD